MKPADNIERSIKDLRIRTTADFDARTLTDALAALEQTRNPAPAPQPADPSGGSAKPFRAPPIWRTIMTSNWFKPAAAAAIIATAAIASFTAFHHSASPAYALEQSVEAHRGPRYIHIRFGPPEAVLSETWAQIGENGEVLRLKMAFAQTEDGPKVVLWEGNQAEVWFKNKRTIGVHHDPQTAATFPAMLKEFEPRQVVEALYQAQAEGRATIETTMPAASGEPITLTATSPAQDGRRTVYLIDPQSKLLQRREQYGWDGQQYRQESRWDYLDYNQEPPADTFTLGAPADTARIDAATQVIGLPKGNLSDEQITVQLARAFFEALIAQDHAKAGQLLSGTPAARVPEILKQLGWDVKFLRIVSIGQPYAQPIAGVGGTEVVCQVEIEANGVKTVRNFTPAMRPLMNSQPERWAIHGGT